MQSRARSVEQYLCELPEDRRLAISAVRSAILENLPEGYEEGMQYGMIGYFVPHSLYPAGYHCEPKQPLPFAGIASQKNHMSIYLMCVYGDPEHSNWFREAWLRAGKRLDMGKGCVRFKNLEDVPLKIVGQAVKKVPVKKFIANYESVLAAGSRNRTTSTVRKKKPAKKA